jgi:cyclophilin family peptidyl-prolyl cis-trans isomerase
MKTGQIVFTIFAVIVVMFFGYKAWEKSRQTPAAEDSLYTQSTDTYEPVGEEELINPLELNEPMLKDASQITPINHAVKVTLKTSKGDIGLELDGIAAPLTVGNFVALAKENFYDGTSFHRVIPDFMIQGGDPLSKDSKQRFVHGTGGPGYRFADETNSRKIVRGAIAMANSGPDTNGSQFFIVVGQAFPHLDGRHTNFGSVISGMDVVDAIANVSVDERDNPLEPVVISDVVVEE